MYSELNHGTTIRLYLPRADSPALSIEVSTPGGPNELMARGESVLVVEDEPRVRKLTVTRLRTLGTIRVLEAANGPAALDLLRAAPDVDLVFTDSRCPAA